MSLAGIIQRNGSVVTVKRATESRSTGGATNKTWATVSTGVPVFIDSPTSEIAQRLFGAEVRVEARAFVLSGVDLHAEDGLIVTAGERSGVHYRVVGEASHSFGAPRTRSTHGEFALVATTETFN